MRLAQRLRELGIEPDNAERNQRLSRLPGRIRSRPVPASWPIPRLVRKNPAHSAARVGSVAAITGDQMHV